ncbi:metallophosphoesterase [Nocardia sp. NPDC049707]|uniref:metallophosphoesterase family protein n=1 Tax=Nocardia sp. NPDC049707 TaxID=3154735 RepID=UPI003438F58B
MTAFESLDPTIIAVAGDWHANKDYAVRAIRYAKEQGAEAVLHVGDFAYDLSPKFLAGVQRALEDTGLMLGWVDGNHDHHERLHVLVEQQGVTPIAIRPNLFYLPRCYRWTWNGVQFLALGGAHSVDRRWRVAGREWWAGETISYQQALQAINDGPADVMICHDVPEGVRIPSIEGNPHGFLQAEIYAAECHRQQLRAVVDEVRPHRLFAGHYHCRQTSELNGGNYRTVVDILADDSGSLADSMTVVDLLSL